MFPINVVFECRTSRCATRLGVGVGEDRALSRQLVDMRCFPRHHAAMVGPDVPAADVITHDHEDVGLSAAIAVVLQTTRVAIDRLATIMALKIFIINSPITYV